MQANNTYEHKEKIYIYIKQIKKCHDRLAQNQADELAKTESKRQT